MFLHTERLNLISENNDLKSSSVAIFGVPFDSTETNIPGQRFAPNAIRDAFLAKETGTLTDKIYDAGNLICVSGNAKNTLQRLEDTIKDLDQYTKTAIPVILGGEHTITLGVVKALKEKYKDLQVVSFDAHFDVKDDFQGEKISHSTVMRRIAELGIPVTVIGARAGSREEHEFAKNINTDPKNVDFTKPTYLSIDMDVFDPAYAPGVGDPEVCGIKPQDVFDILAKNINLAGADIVEANPMIEKHITCSLAADLLLKIFKAKL